MPDDAQDIAQKQVTLIPTDRIRILNPRVRNRRTFEEMVENIAKIGLKRPITVAHRAGTDPAEYDLVCGQGRLEAYMELQQGAISAIVIDADEGDCLVMRLVENCARRQHNPIDLMREIGNLRKRGYNDRQIANKIGVTPDYVGMIAGLLERGEERLVSAVETGLLPLNLAIDISKTDAEGGQRALMDAYTQKKLRGKKLAAVRRLIQQRDAQGPHLHRNRYGRSDGAKRPLTSDALVETSGAARSIPAVDDRWLGPSHSEDLSCAIRDRSRSPRPRGCQTRLAKQTPGAVTVESVDLTDVTDFASEIDIVTPGNLEAALDFAFAVMTGVDRQSIALRATTIAAGRNRTPPAAHELAAIKYREVGDAESLIALFDSLEATQGSRTFRPEILRTCIKALRSSGPDVSFLDAAKRIREQQRILGRLLPKKAVGSPLLLKGLEGDVAVILDAKDFDRNALKNRKNLYVAMTRGSRKLVVCSSTHLLG